MAGRDKAVSPRPGALCHVGCLRCDVCGAPLRGDFFLRGDRLVCRNELRVTNRLSNYRVIHLVSKNLLLT